MSQIPDDVLRLATEAWRRVPWECESRDVIASIASAILADRASQAALIAEAREQALEEAAKLAWRWTQSSWQDEVFAARSISDAIRALSPEAPAGLNSPKALNPFIDNRKILQQTSPIHMKWIAKEDRP